MSEPRELGRRTRDLRVSLDMAEQSLASRLHSEDGLDIDGLAAAAYLTREEASARIDRYRRERA